MDLLGQRLDIVAVDPVVGTQRAGADLYDNAFDLFKISHT
jgi:hypothetical protein